MGASNPEREPRQSRLLKATLVSDRFGRFDVTLRNISQSGIGGSGAHVLTAGDRVMVELPGHPALQGTVRWANNTRFGIETDQAIQLCDLHACYGGKPAAVDGINAFRIIPPPKVDLRRPGLKLGAASQPDHGHSDWTSN